MQITASATFGSPGLDVFVRQALCGQPGEWPASTTDGERDVFMQRVDQHGIGPVLYGRLRDGALGVPAPIASQLRARLSQTAAENHVRLRALREVLTSLAAAGIRTAVLKGAALAATVYPEPAWRSMADLDLLVAPAERWRAQDTLLGLGYSESMAGAMDCPAVYDNQVMLVRSLGRGITCGIELHWHIMGNPLFYPLVATERLLERVRTVHGAWLGEFFVLDRYDQLLHVALHLCCTSPERRELRRVVDFDQMVRQAAVDPSWNWDALVTRAGEIGAVLSLREAVSLAREWCDTPIPDDIQAAVASMGASPEERRAFDAARDPGRRFSRLRELATVRQRLAYVRHVLVPIRARVSREYAIAHRWDWLGAYLRWWWLLARQQLRRR